MKVVLFAKLGAYAYSGSGAMLSEAMHSGADVMNQSLLFYGLQRSAKVSVEVVT
jgi:zinc transporter 9